MKIIFEGPDETNGYIEFFAISQLEIYKGKAYDELMWAEIRYYGPGKWRVVWEDDWQNKIWCYNLEEAKDYILKNYTNHAPFINGTAFDIEELL